MSNHNTWDQFLTQGVIDWKVSLLGELFSNRQETNFPSMKLLSVTANEGIVERDSLDRRDTSNSDKSKYLRVVPGDIAYNTMRMWQGVSGRVTQEGIVSPAYTVLTPTDQINSYYGAFLLKLPLLVQKFHQNSQGLVDDTLNLKYQNFSQIRVKIPPLEQQQKIAEILTSVDEVIENTQSQINKMEDLKRATMNELLTEGIGHTEFKETEIGRIPENWEIKELGELGKFTRGKGISKSETSDQGLPCIRYAEIYTDYDVLISTFFSHISEDIAQNSVQIKPRDILFAGSGETIEDIGKSVTFVCDEIAYGGGDLVIFRPKSDFNSIFLCYQLNDPHRRIQLRKRGQGSSVMHIYASELATVKVVLPPITEQDRIAEVFLSFWKQENRMENHLRNLHFLKKSLMQDLLTGKVRVTVN